MKNLVVILSIIIVLTSAVEAQKYEWAISSRGKLVDEGNSVCMDAAGNSYITGSFSSRPFGIGPFAFANSSLPGKRINMDMFVAKLDKTGKVVWAIQSEGDGDEKAADISCDRTGHIIIVGSFKGQKARFGETEITNPRANSISIFILKMNALGKINWVKNEAQNSIKPVVNGVSSGPDGEFFITGTFTRRGNFGGYNYRAKNGNNPAAFVAKYLPNGQLKWLHQIYGKSGGGQTSLQSGEAVFATNDSRFVYVAGWFRGHVTFSDSGKTLTSNDFRDPKFFGGQRNFFITKYQADDAREVWTQTIGVKQVNYSTSPEITGIVVDQEGSSFVTGHFPGILLFGEEQLKTNVPHNAKSYNFDIFLAKFDQNGKHLWHRNAGGTEDDRSNSLALTSGGVLITGSVSRNVRFGKVSLLSGGINSMFTARYDTDGNALWAIGDNNRVLAGINRGDGIATDGKNMVVIGTYLGNRIGFGNVELKETGSSNIFVARME